MKRWTTSVSKQLAAIITVTGIIFAFKQPEISVTILPASWAAATALVVTKTGSEAYKHNKEE
jgi:hypothetical protein